MLDSVVVVVLGDIGHSPRMVRHAQELLRNGYRVECIAYLESRMPKALESPHFVFHPIPVLPRIHKNLMVGAFKLLVQTLWLLWILLVRISRRPALILSQNPPSLPLLFVLPFVAWTYNLRWIVDWHNMSYSILRLKYGKECWQTKVARWVEYRLGKLADAHLCVTFGMKRDLILHGYPRDKILVCHDRPPKQFRRIGVEQVHNLFQTLGRDIPKLKVFVAGNHHDQTPLTTGGPAVQYRPDRPALVVSSTSWTVDENFEMLFDAIDQVEKSKSIDRLPKVLLIITGKGPFKSRFVKKYEQVSWTKFTVCFAWLEYGHYQKLLGCADLGISMHFSSSGLDFPMKVVDMIGSGLPVLSMDFECASEVIQSNVNGRLFGTSNELSCHLIDLLIDFPYNDRLQSLQRSCEKETFWEESWSEHWLKHVKPFVVSKNPGPKNRFFYVMAAAGLVIVATGWYSLIEPSLDHL